MTLVSRLRSELHGLLDLLLPPACPLCGAEMPCAPGRPALCRSCTAGIQPLTSPCCPRCALPYPTEAGSDHLCEPCLREPPPFDWVGPLGIYSGALRTAVGRFKYQGAVGLDRPLAQLLAAALAARAADFAPDLLIPVPLHIDRLRERTYNQSHLLARRLGVTWRVPVPARLLVRLRPTAPQQGLQAEVRRRNLRGAFALRKPLDGQRVLLVDDVLTTGATARECCRVLLDHGAGAVAVAVLGRAARHTLPETYS